MSTAKTSTAFNLLVIRMIIIHQMQLHHPHRAYISSCFIVYFAARLQKYHKHLLTIFHDAVTTPRKAAISRELLLGWTKRVFATDKHSLCYSDSTIFPVVESFFSRVYTDNIC